MQFFPSVVVEHFGPFEHRWSFRWRQSCNLDVGLTGSVVVQSSPVQANTKITQHYQLLYEKSVLQCTMQFAPYQRGLGGVSALALLLQTRYKLVLGTQHGGQGSIFLLQLPVVA